MAAYAGKSHQLRELQNWLVWKYKFAYKELINRWMTNVPCHIETSQLICIVNQFTGSYMMGNIGR